MRIALIAAVGPQRVIGADNDLPWRLPKDLKFFRRVTLGHVVIMGRKTFDSFGRRPLPKRTNIVLSRNSNFEGKGIITCHSLEDALATAKRESSTSRIFIIGGETIYQQAIAVADEIYLSSIEDRGNTESIFGTFIPGDAFFPKIPADEWMVSHVGRYFKAKNTLQRARTSSHLYFRIWKLTRHKTNCSINLESRPSSPKSFPSIDYWSS